MNWSSLPCTGLILGLSTLFVLPAGAADKPTPDDAAESNAETEKGGGENAEAEDSNRATKAPPQTTAGRAALEKAEDARARAKKARAGGNDAIAKRLLRAAALWKKTAALQIEAAKLERQAASIERKTLELKSQARRARLVVEQTESRRARALARLRELGLDDEAPKKDDEGEVESGEDDAPEKAGNR